jgi:hypothetical protein
MWTQTAKLRQITSAVYETKQSEMDEQLVPTQYVPRFNM